MNLISTTTSSKIIGWIDWENFMIDPNTTISDLSVPLSNELTLRFNVTNTTLSSEGATIYSAPIPTCNKCSFGTIGYTKLNGNIALQPFNEYIYMGSLNKITLNNIRITNINGPNISNFTFLIASSEIANCDGDIQSELQKYNTNGGNWSVFDWIGKHYSPDIIGINSTTATLLSHTNNSGAAVLSTESPSTIDVTLTYSSGLTSVAFGIYIP